MTAQREMTLEEYCAKLPESHRANVEYRALKAQPEQEPDVLEHPKPTQAQLAYLPPSPDFYAPPQLERNFCERCGKRTADLTVIHTCTPPPQEKNT
jgi:hypothetical protein